MMRALWLCLLLAGCGGGGGNADPGPPAPPPAVRAIHFGYFGDFDDVQLPATAAHTSITMEGDVNLAAHMNVARANGLKVILTVEKYLYAKDHYIGTPEAVRPILVQLRKLGMLDLVIGFYPADEPDLHYTDAEVRAANRDLRLLCAQYPEMGSCLLMVIYSDHQPVGLDSYDWVGQDRYGSGVVPFPILPSQCLILIPGGADPWREQPDAFVSYAQSHPEVCAVIAFVYPFYSAPGISTNGMAGPYCRAGRTLTQKANAPCPG